MDLATASVAVGIGLAGAGHCLGMCGGIAAGLSLASDARPSWTVAYHVGRVASYGLLGAIVAGLATSLDIAAWTLLLRYLAGALLVAMGLYIADWWRGLVLLERAGALLWRPVQRRVAPLLPLRHWRHALVLGAVWGLMPCGLIYSALAWSATAAGPLEGGARMLLFGAGTLPAMLGASYGAAQLRALLQRRALKRLLGILLILAGAWSLGITWRHSGHLSGPHSEEAVMHEHMHHGA